jgi:hypothetical protein
MLWDCFICFLKEEEESSSDGGGGSGGKKGRKSRSKLEYQG